MGAIANVDAAESFAQNNPWGLENEAINAVKGAASAVSLEVAQAMNLWAASGDLEVCKEGRGLLCRRKEYELDSNPYFMRGRQNTDGSWT